jgi:hypothetical protein
MTGSRSEVLQERMRVLRLIEAKLMHNLRLDVSQFDYALTPVRCLLAPLATRG